MKIKLELKDSTGNVIQTLETASTELRTGMVKRLYKTMDIDALTKGKSADEVYSEILMRVIASYEIFEDYILEIFPGLTREDIDEKTTPTDIANVIVALVMITLTNLSEVGKNLKNLLTTAEISA